MIARATGYAHPNIIVTRDIPALPHKEQSPGQAMVITAILLKTLLYSGNLQISPCQAKTAA